MRVQFALVDDSGAQVGHINWANMKLKDTYNIRGEN
jgi:hypothetical protein